MKTIRKNITPLEDRFLTKLIDKLRTKEGVVALVLYGSRAIGFSNEDSDLDLALITEKSLPYYELNSIKDEIIEEMFIVGELRIDLFNFTEDEIKHLPIGKEIKEKGLLLWKKDWNLQKVL
jgi:predicted nucleotidyltransferase